MRMAMRSPTFHRRFDQLRGRQVEACRFRTAVLFTTYIHSRRRPTMALPPILRDRLRLPVIASPLFIISNPDLVIAQCKAGIVGSFPSLNARPISLLDEWLDRITSERSEE